MNVRKSDDFIAEVESEFEWYAVNADWRVAERYLAAVEATCQLLGKYPQLGPAGGFAHVRLHKCARGGSSTQKESVFRAALDLEFERDQFRTTFASLVSTLLRHDRSGLGEPGGGLNETAEASAFVEAGRA